MFTVKFYAVFAILKIKMLGVKEHRCQPEGAPIGQILGKTEYQNKQW